MSDREHGQLAENVLRVRGRLSYRQLSTKTGLTKAVLHKAATGGSVSPTTLQAIADATGEDRSYWYRIGGYPELAERDDEPQAGPAARPSWLVTEAPEHYDDEDAVFDRLFHLWQFDPPAPGAERERLKAMVRGMLEASNRFDV